MNAPITVFYRDEMNAPMQNEKSPGIWKARELMKMISPEPECSLRDDFGKITRGQLLVAHSPDYVDGVLSLDMVNGHGDRREDVLNAILWQNGSLLAATEHALANRTIAFSPTSGFHHAGHYYGGGYCTFNGLMVAASRCIEKYNLPVLIIDGDAHFGDGCVDIINLYTPGEFEAVQYITTSSCTDATSFEMKIAKALRNFRGLVLYQAGADCHKDDSLQSGYYSTEEMVDRDSLVFMLCRGLEIPVVWNLAGGYGAPGMRDTLRLHYNTWRTATEVYC